MHLIGSFLFPPKRFELLGIGAAVLAGGGFSNLSTNDCVLEHGVVEVDGVD